MRAEFEHAVLQDRRRILLSMASHRLDQHRAALAAADALGGDAALLAEPFHAH